MNKRIKAITRCYTILLGLVFSLSLSAQGWELLFGEIYSTGQTVLKAHDDNYILQGEEVNPGNNVLEKYLTKVTQSGDQIWKIYYPKYGDSKDQLLLAPDGNYLGLSQVNVIIGTATYGKTVIFKFDDNGQFIWNKIIEPNATSPHFGYFLSVDENGNLNLLFNYQAGTHEYLLRMDESGNSIAEHSVDNQLVFDQVQKSSDNGFLFSNMSELGYLQIFEIDTIGNLLNTYSYPQVEGDANYKLIQKENENWVVFRNTASSNILTQTFIDHQSGTVTTNIIGEEKDALIDCLPLADGYILAGYDNNNSSTVANFLIRTDNSGGVLWERIIDHRSGGQACEALGLSSDGGFLVAGTYINDIGTNFSYLFKTDSLGNIYSNFISGNVVQDQNGDCLVDSDEIPIVDWIVTAQKGVDIFYTSSDQYGEYILSVDTGDYVISIFPPSSLWEVCENNVSINIPTLGSQVDLDFPIKIGVECPSLSVSQSIPTLRPCFERPGFITYCNYGTTVAVDAYIELTYDSLIIQQTSSIPSTALPGNVYRFEIGDIEPLECGSFQVGLFLNCDATVGASYCAEAHAYPDSICQPSTMPWTGAFLEVSGSCEEDKINFRIENVGNGNMTDYSDFVIIEDILLREIDSVELEQGMSLDTSLSANGSTFTIIAEQVVGAPGMSNPIAVVEGCGENDNGDFSIGFTNQFPLDDANPFLDNDCPIAISSFDPNDKQGFPIGYKGEHFILPETPIEYLIRFQNTGTDTAYTVVIRDTLDANLDPATFIAGASSHDYNLSFEGERTLKFTFNNILLPDSIVDESGSNGFVEYKIAPQEDTPLGTVIKNKAGIYFDFNEPVITNETFHTIDIDFIEVEPSSTTHPELKNIKVKVQPNPFVSQTEIIIENHKAKEYILKIFNVNGQLVKSASFANSNIILKRLGLSSGIYFYQLTANDGFKHIGKIIAY